MQDAVIGLGADLCAVSRFSRELNDGRTVVLAAVFVETELAWGRAQPRPDRALAACFAAKEAVVKALARTQGRGTFWRDIEIRVDEQRQPVVALRGRLARLAGGLGVRHVVVAWAHDRLYATACAVVTG